MYVRNASQIYEGGGVADFLTTTVRAKVLVRKMHGGSQSVLIKGDDDELYIVKFNNNQQGPNLLANEMLGSVLLRSVGLPAPQWKAVVISDEFLASNQNLHFEGLSGTEPICSGIHFGSNFLGSTGDAEVYDFLPSSFCRRIANPADFLGIYIFDVWANHHDHRQALFLCRPQNLEIDAHFIDNGHLFGGPHWSFEERCGAAMCLDPKFYAVPWNEHSIDEWVSRFESSLSQNLRRTVKQVPKDWYKGDIIGLTTYLEFRLENLRQLFQHELQHNPRIRADVITGISNAPMQLRNSRPLQVRSVLGRRSMFVTPRYWS